MKQLILSAIILGVGYSAGAQNSGSQSSNSTSVSPAAPSAKSSKGTKGKKSVQTKTDSIDHSKTYNWKDGQRATPTGHEATGTNGAHATLPKDSATMQRDSTKQ